MSEVLELHLDITFGPGLRGAVLVLVRSGTDQRRYIVPERAFRGCLVEAIDEMIGSRGGRD